MNPTFAIVTLFAALGTIVGFSGTVAADQPYVLTGPVFVGKEQIAAVYALGGEITMVVTDDVWGSQVGGSVCQDFGNDAQCDTGAFGFCGTFTIWEDQGLISAGGDLLAFIDGGAMAGVNPCGDLVPHVGTHGHADTYC